jgi:hypothetical protein
MAQDVEAASLQFLKCSPSRLHLETRHRLIDRTQFERRVLFQYQEEIPIPYANSH